MLHAFSTRGHNKWIKWLIEKSSDVNKLDKNGVSPLFYAIDEGHVSTIELLLEYGADVKNLERVLLDLVCKDLHSSKQNEIRAMIIKKQYELLQKNFVLNPDMELHTLAQNKNRIDELKMFLSTSTTMNVDDLNVHGFTALHYASKADNEVAVKLLLEKKADPTRTIYAFKPIDIALHFDNKNAYDSIVLESLKSENKQLANKTPRAKNCKSKRQKKNRLQQTSNLNIISEETQSVTTYMTDRELNLLEEQFGMFWVWSSYMNPKNINNNLSASNIELLSQNYDNSKNFDQSMKRNDLDTQKMKVQFDDMSLASTNFNYEESTANFSTSEHVKEDVDFNERNQEVLLTKTQRKKAFQVFKNGIEIKNQPNANIKLTPENVNEYIGKYWSKYDPEGHWKSYNFVGVSYHTKTGGLHLKPFYLEICANKNFDKLITYFPITNQTCK